LGVTRLEMEAILQSHQVCEDLPSETELARARARLKLDSNT
jgi:hypothetical protein